MPKYSIHLITTTSTVIDFETDETEPDKIEAAFWDQPGGVDLPTLCHHCSGGSRYGQNLEIGDEWDIYQDSDGNLSIEPLTDEDQDDD